MSDVRPSNKIYLTYKARMVAEAKLRLLSKAANLLIVWFSFWLIALSILQLTKTVYIAYYEALSASASIAIFAASIFLATGILEKRADEFRKCYLELQKIWNCEVSEKEKLRRYDEALPKYQNHSQNDYQDMIFECWKKNDRLFDTSGPIIYSNKILCFVVIRKFVFWSFAATLLFLPIFLTVSLANIVPNAI
jgi:tetratricopeptide (TPR) repeat protein